jgi:hypothetical protein
MNLLEVLKAFLDNNYGTVTPEEVIAQLKPGASEELIQAINQFPTYRKRLNWSWGSFEFYYSGSLPATVENGRLTRGHIDSTTLVTKNAFSSLSLEWVCNKGEWIKLK